MYLCRYLTFFYSCLPPLSSPPLPTHTHTHRRWHRWGHTGWRWTVRLSPCPRLQSISGPRAAIDAGTGRFDAFRSSSRPPMSSSLPLFPSSSRSQVWQTSPRGALRGRSSFLWQPVVLPGTGHLHQQEGRVPDEVCVFVREHVQVLTLKDVCAHQQHSLKFHFPALIHDEPQLCFISIGDSSINTIWGQVLLFLNKFLFLQKNPKPSNDRMFIML